MNKVLTAQDLLKNVKTIRKTWKCTQCGYCCESFEIGLKNDDWDRWKDVIVNSNLGKYPMRKFCNVKSKIYSKLGDLFFHPKTGEHLDNCPFLYKKNTKYYCLINDPEIKPNTCKDFNTNFIDLRCENVRKIYTNIFKLKFDSKEEELQYYMKIDPEFFKLQQATSLFKSIYEFAKILSEE